MDISRRFLQIAADACLPFGFPVVPYHLLFEELPERLAGEESCASRLAVMGVTFMNYAPKRATTKAGDRVKTDNRDAEKLACAYRAGDLTAVWVPDATHEALRDMVRAREDARQEQPRARHRLGKFLLRHIKRLEKVTLLLCDHREYSSEIVHRRRFNLPAGN